MDHGFGSAWTRHGYLTPIDLFFRDATGLSLEIYESAYGLTSLLLSSRALPGGRFITIDLDASTLCYHALAEAIICNNFGSGAAFFNGG